MLDPWIIEEIRRREEAQRREREACYVELPIYEYDHHREDAPEPKEPEESKRGVVVIDL
jgi:hypothetical protein